MGHVRELISEPFFYWLRLLGRGGMLSQQFLRGLR